MANIFLIIHEIFFSIYIHPSIPRLATPSMKAIGGWNPNSLCCILLPWEGGVRGCHWHVLLPLYGLEPSSESSLTVILFLLNVDQVVSMYYLEAIIPVMYFFYSHFRKHGYLGTYTNWEAIIENFGQNRII